jgi:hypothetical protein
MAGLAIITEACIDVKDRACVEVCPVQCIYEFDPVQNVLFSEAEAGSGSSRRRTRRIRTRSPCSATASSTSTSRNARRAPPATSLTSVPWAPSTPRSTCRTAHQRARSTTPKTRTRAMTTRSSSSTVGTSSRTSGSSRAPSPDLATDRRSQSDGARTARRMARWQRFALRTSVRVDRATHPEPAQHLEQSGAASSTTRGYSERRSGARGGSPGLRVTCRMIQHVGNVVVRNSACT